MGYFIQAAMLFYTTSSCLSYVILIGDFIPSSITAAWPGRGGLSAGELRFYTIMIVGVFVLLPLSFIRNLYSLRFTSAISLVSILYTVGLTVASVRDSPSLSTAPATVKVFDFPICSFLSISIMNVAFTAHYNASRYYQELRDRSLARYTKAVVWAMVAALFLYALMAIAGYWRFGSATMGDVLDNFSDRDDLAMIARLALALGVSCSFPLCFHAIRTSIFTLFSPELLLSQNQRWHNRKYVAMTTLLVALNVALGIVLKDIEVVLIYKGSLFGCAVVYAFPCAMFLALRKQVLGKRERKEHEREQRRKRREQLTVAEGEEEGNTLPVILNGPASQQHQVKPQSSIDRAMRVEEWSYDDTRAPPPPPNLGCPSGLSSKPKSFFSGGCPSSSLGVSLFGTTHTSSSARLKSPMLTQAEQDEAEEEEGAQQNNGRSYHPPGSLRTSSDDATLAPSDSALSLASPSVLSPTLLQEEAAEEARAAVALEYDEYAPMFSPPSRGGQEEEEGEDGEGGEQESDEEMSPDHFDPEASYQSGSAGEPSSVNGGGRASASSFSLANSSPSGPNLAHSPRAQVGIFVRMWRWIVGEDVRSAQQRHDVLSFDAITSPASLSVDSSHVRIVSPPWLTLESTAFSMVIAGLFIWGVLIGAIGVVVNIIVQSGGLNQCSESV
jgi:amino acid permease